MRVTLLSVCLFSFLLAPVSSACVSQYYPSNSGGSIGVHAGSGWGTTPPPIGNAINIWSDGCSGMGTTFPTLFDGSNGTINVSVDRVQGRNPQAGGGCGRFDHDLDANGAVAGGSIEIFQFTNAGDDCAWVMAHANLDNLIAHELGHVLGLATVRRMRTG